MQRLADHFRAALPESAGAGLDVAAEREAGRPALRCGRFRGLPLWHHVVPENGGEHGDDGVAFDPDDAIACLQFEHYVAAEPRASDPRRLRSAYYALKPMLPRAAQLALQRLNARRRMRAVSFPRWPADSTLTDLCGALLAARMARAGLDRVPFIGFWPGEATWAWCLTHDIDTGSGQAASAALAEVEEARGLRSAWFVVPERYPVDHGLLSRLRAAGHEIGVHGLQHSGRLFESRPEFDRRCDRINSYVREWSAVGFRSPATYRNPFWLPELDVQYDSSYMDNATFEPQRGGVCSAFPFMLSERLVELPITLPMDHTLVNVLRRDVLAACREKLGWAQAQHGIALSLFHPDYNADTAGRQRYDAVLSALAAARGGWFALPCQVADWWQRRRGSRVVWSGSTPRIEGPAAGDARIWWAHRDGDRIGIEPSA